MVISLTSCIQQGHKIETWYEKTTGEDSAILCAVTKQCVADFLELFIIEK